MIQSNQKDRQETQCWRRAVKLCCFVSILALTKQQLGWFHFDDVSSLLPRTEEKARSSENTKQGYGLCHQNPYKPSLTDSLEVVSHRMDDWMANLDSHLNHSQSDLTLRKWTHRRFDFFQEMTSCGTFSCVGGPCRADASKIACGNITNVHTHHNQATPPDKDKPSSDEKQPQCTIYSIGGNNKWSFETDSVRKTPCHVHTFDCTGPTTRFKKPSHDRIHFHHVCLGDEFEAAPATCDGTAKCGETWPLEMVQEKLGHAQIDLFKMDIEGFEFGIFDSWKNATASQASDVRILPMQVLVEVHYKTQFAQLRVPNPEYTLPKEFKTPRDIVLLQRDLLEMGYVVVKRDDNRACRHCTELTLVRIICPQTGVYAIGS